MLIVFCKDCGRRVAEDELSSGKARRVDEMEVLCSDCNKPAAKSATSSSLLPQTKTSKVMKAMPRRASSTAATHIAVRIEDGPSKAQRNRTLVIIAASASVCFLLLGILIFSGGDKSKDVAQAKPDKKPAETKAPETPHVVTTPPPPALPNPTPVVAKADPRPPAPTPAQTDTPQQLPGMLNNSADNDMVNFRNELAAKSLKEAQDFATANPKDPWTYKDKLESVSRSYRSTPAGDQAAKILADLKVPEKPKPPEPKGDGEWKPIFNGKSMDPIWLGGAGGWHIENGALIKEAEKDNAPQSRDDFGDGEFRFRFETHGCSSAHFTVRQSSTGSCSVYLNRDQMGADVKTHEVIFTCSGDQVTAKLDGAAIPISGDPKATHSGRMQFNAKDGPFRLLAIDQRKIAAQ